MSSPPLYSPFNNLCQYNINIEDLYIRWDDACKDGYVQSGPKALPLMSNVSVENDMMRWGCYQSEREA